MHMCMAHALEMIGVMNIKIGCKDTYVQVRIENTEGEKCANLPFLELHVQTLLPWAESIPCDK